MSTSVPIKLNIFELIFELFFGMEFHFVEESASSEILIQKFDTVSNIIG